MQKTPGSITTLFTTSQGGSDHGVTGFPRFDKEEAAGEMELSPDNQAASVGLRTGVREGTHRVSTTEAMSPLCLGHNLYKHRFT